MSAKGKSKSGDEAYATHRKASHDYQLLEKFEAGLVLTGTEVKSIKLGHVSIQEGYVTIDDRLEMWLVGATIQPYAQGSMYNHELDRPRKLLMQKKEIERLYGKIREKGLTLIPLRLYPVKGKIKLAVALGRGKDQVDKRDTIKKRESERDTRRALRDHNR